MRVRIAARTGTSNQNLPITQFYDITTDNAKPFYNVYGGTQDNFSFGGPSRTRSASGIVNSDWFVTNGGDGFRISSRSRRPEHHLRRTSKRRARAFRQTHGRTHRHSTAARAAATDPYVGTGTRHSSSAHTCTRDSISPPTNSSAATIAETPGNSSADNSRAISIATNSR